jgi:hypothetical protein
MDGLCTYGDGCRFLHGAPCPNCHRACLHPHNPDVTQGASCWPPPPRVLSRDDRVALTLLASPLAHMRVCQPGPVMTDEARVASQRLDCGVCLEPVHARSARFGLLCACSPCTAIKRSQRDKRGTATDMHKRWWWSTQRAATTSFA